MQNLHPLMDSGPQRRFWGGLVAAALVGCRAAPVTPVEREPVGLPAATGLSQGITFDVDPVRSSAFERVEGSGPANALPLAVYVPRVTHDRVGGTTRLHLAVTSAGGVTGPVTYTLEAAKDLKAPAPPLGSFPVGGGTRAISLAFDNPGAESFSLRLDLRGVQGGTGSDAGPVSRQLLSLSSPVATASSTLAGFGAARAVDGNTDTEWASAEYRGAEAALTLDAGAVQTLTGLTAKIRPSSGGAFYRLEVSNTGASYVPVTGHLRNATWNLETKSLPAGTQARFLRLHFFNDPTSPETRFSVFEARLLGSDNLPVPTPTPTASPPGPTPTPLPSAPASGSLNESFGSYAVGADPAIFVDPLDEGYSFSWMPRIPWRVTSLDGSLQYLHDGNATRSNLSFRRYRGTALGTANGRMPERYFAQVKVTPLRSNSLYAPTGDQGTPFYYRDPTHYVELLLKPHVFEVWVANGAQPFSGTGWQRIFYAPTETAAGQSRVLACEVDTGLNAIKIYLDGGFRGTRTHGLLNTQEHFLALRGAGNVVAHDDLVIQRR